MTTWFTSDQHFGHRNIIEYSKRPFSSVSEMNVELVKRFNARVGEEDSTWHLGDFAMDDRLVKSFLSCLNGVHFLIAGNHDKCHACHSRHARWARKYIEMGFDIVEQSVHYQHGGGPFFAFGEALFVHMPPCYADVTDLRYPEYRPDIQTVPRLTLHGHVHEKYKMKIVPSVEKILLNVGVDQWDYAPVSDVEIDEYLRKNVSFWGTK